MYRKRLTVETLPPNNIKFWNNLKTVILYLQRDVSMALQGITCEKDEEEGHDKYCFRDYYIGKNNIAQIIFKYKKDSILIEYFDTINSLAREENYISINYIPARNSILLSLWFMEGLNLLIPWIWTIIFEEMINLARQKWINKIIFTSLPEATEFYFKILDLQIKLWNVSRYILTKKKLKFIVFL